MITLPSPCIGVITSASASALRIITVNGSRYMIKAVRNGPIRTVETNTNRTPNVTAALTPIKAAQPPLVCGPVQFSVASDTTTNTTVDDNCVYQVVIRASAPTR